MFRGLKVIKYIESGKYTIAEARRIYDINGGETIMRFDRLENGSQELLKKRKKEAKEEELTTTNNCQLF